MDDFSGTTRATGERRASSSTEEISGAKRVTGERRASFSMDEKDEEGLHFRRRSVESLSIFFCTDSGASSSTSSATSTPRAAAGTTESAVEPAGEDPLADLRQPFLVPQSTNSTPIPPKTPSPSVNTDTAAENTLLMPKEEDETWNKRQIGYVFVLGTTVALVFVLRPYLPAAYDRLILLVTAAVWAVGSVGLPCGLYGTARWEKDCSRHVGWLIYIFFSVFVIYGFYLLAVRKDDTAAAQDSTDESWWTVNFAAVGLYVLVGALVAWIRGCCTGGDRDIYP